MSETETEPDSQSPPKRRRGRPKGSLSRGGRQDYAIQVRWRPERVALLEPTLTALQEAERALGLSTVTPRSPYLSALIEVALERPEVVAETQRRLLARRGYAPPTGPRECVTCGYAPCMCDQQ